MFFLSYFQILHLYYRGITHSMVDCCIDLCCCWLVQFIDRWNFVEGSVISSIEEHFVEDRREFSSLFLSIWRFKSNSNLCSNCIIYALSPADFDDRERCDILDDCLELEVMKVFVSVVTKLLSSVFSPLAFVANYMLEGSVGAACLSG